MKYVMASMVVALVACAGPKNDGPPPREPVSTTQTTSSALTSYEEVQPAAAADTEAPILAAKEADRSLATKIQARLARDKALDSVAWRTRVKMVVEDQHVTLRGNLPTLADSTELERAVREVKGVRAVTSEIHSDDAYRH